MEGGGGCHSINWQLRKIKFGTWRKPTTRLFTFPQPGPYSWITTWSGGCTFVGGLLNKCSPTQRIRCAPFSDGSRPQAAIFVHAPKFRCVDSSSSGSRDCPNVNVKRNTKHLFLSLLIIFIIIDAKNAMLRGSWRWASWRRVCDTKCYCPVTNTGPTQFVSNQRSVEA